MARMPDLYARLRMASRAVLLGIALFVAAFVVVTGDPTIVWEPAILYRIVPIGAFLLLTTPFATRVIRGAADRRRRGHREP